jgi:hypothetical protein
MILQWMLLIFRISTRSFERVTARRSQDKSRSKFGHLVRGYPQFHLTTDALSDPILDRIFADFYEADERIECSKDRAY